MNQERFFLYEEDTISSAYDINLEMTQQCTNTMTHLEWLVNHRGIDSLSYLALEGNKQFFVSESGDGFISYVSYHNLAICIGNPICETKDRISVTLEFLSFCTKLNWRICFCSITLPYCTELKNLGFSVSAYGQEAIIDLQSYQLSGKKTEKLRQKYNRCTHAGVQVLEYCPSTSRDFELEEKIAIVSQHWFSTKGQEMDFAFGNLHFDEPLERRYFLALDEDGNCQCITMFSPYKEKKGYFLDVMRRRGDSIPGSMEKTILDAMNVFRQEQVTSISLGITPLSGLDENRSCFLEHLFHFVYEHGNFAYNFKSLYHFKCKFNPSLWETRYIAYDKRLMPLWIVYAMAKVRNVDHLSKKIVHCLFYYMNMKWNTLLTFKSFKGKETSWK